MEATASGSIWRIRGREIGVTMRGCRITLRVDGDQLVVDDAHGNTIHTLMRFPERDCG